MVDTTPLEVPIASARTRAWTLCVACLGVLLVISSMVALNTALGDIAVAMSASQTQLTWIVDGYTLALACLLLPAGAIGDRFGRRAALLAGLAVFGVASVIPALSSDPGHVIAARVVAGAGAAFIMPATLSLLTTAYPKEQRTKAIAIWAGIAGCGAIVGMLGTGLLLAIWSWQAVFWGFAIGAALTFVLTLTVKESKDPATTPLDGLGAVTIGVAVAVLVFGILEAPARGWGHPVVLSCIAAGIVLIAVFGVLELRVRHPLLDVRLFRVPEFGTGAAAITVLFMTMFGFFYLEMQFLQLVLGYSPLGTAVALSPLAVPLLILSPLSAWYLPRLGLRFVVFTGLMLMAIGLLGMRGLAVDASYAELAWPLLVMSTGVGLFTAPTTSAIMTSAPDDKQGVASAVNDTTREMGAALGIALAGSMLAARYTHEIMPALGRYPEPLRTAAAGSIGEALNAATRLGSNGTDLAFAAKMSFLYAMQGSLTVLAIVTAGAAVLISMFAPGRDGKALFRR
ncbi:MFS transporter [Mycolicibacterium fluoranthenivorans]|jgi:EmrB/QacA subfamily drug resistance transporter|uniref:Drug resistance transporter, EmrB/QacA subfamily n=1 Tax=Mycolicibacterium fluoranthenivorans TaxID=258505 RepID=A0A1G4WM82_9MYCO|nr:MFS transporter [Mycolicibacterium fluoranthenivorans]SCX25662.1 drug resistance transporter, EmrB/QacA subfamily [Mycolicibacterium fluoranthenivorans]